MPRTRDTGTAALLIGRRALETIYPTLARLSSRRSVQAETMFLVAIRARAESQACVADTVEPFGDTSTQLSHSGKESSHGDFWFPYEFVPCGCYTNAMRCCVFNVSFITWATRSTVAEVDY